MFNQHNHFWKVGFVWVFFPISRWCKKKTPVTSPCLNPTHCSCAHHIVDTDTIYCTALFEPTTERRECFQKNLRHWCSMGCRCLEVVAVLPCARVSSAVLLLKGPSAWLIQDYTGRQLVSFQWVSALLSVMLEERLPWNQLSSLCCITLPTWWCTVLVTSPIWDLTRHVVQLLLGCDFIASVRMCWDGFQS